jgi:hypothetical protein
VGADALLRVAIVTQILDAQAASAGDLEPFDATQKFGALSCEHRTHDQLDAATRHRLKSLEIVAILVGHGWHFLAEAVGGCDLKVELNTVVRKRIQRCGLGGIGGRVLLNEL